MGETVYLSARLVSAVIAQIELRSRSGGPWYEARPSKQMVSLKTVNVKSDRPSVVEALQRLERELALARQENTTFLKLIHGYGSTGAGGDIHIAVQRRLMEMTERGHIHGCIFGENWSKSDETTWRILQSHPELKSDRDLGRRNRGITIVIL